MLSSQKQNQLKKAKVELQKTNEELVQVDQKLQGSRSNYQEIKVSLSAAKSRGTVLESLMKARARGVLPGICVGFLAPTLAETSVSIICFFRVDWVT